MFEKNNLQEEFAKITDYWSPRAVALANGQYVKLAKVKGEFVRHNHDEEDEFFLVVKGEFHLRYDNQNVILTEGDFHVTPKGAYHHPFAPVETWIMFVEPVATAHTGNEASELTKSVDSQTAELAQ